MYRQEPPTICHTMQSCAGISPQQRCVWCIDASAKSANSPSLNDCLLKGPKFNQLIFDLLVPFRSYKIYSLDCRSGEGVFDGVNKGCRSWRVAIHLGRWLLKGVTWAEGLQIHSSCVWGVFKSFPSQCHNMVPFGEVSGDTWKCCSPTTLLYIRWWHRRWWTNRRRSLQSVYSIQRNLSQGRIQPEKVLDQLKTSTRMNRPQGRKLFATVGWANVLGGYPWNLSASEERRTQGSGSSMGSWIRSTRLWCGQHCYTCVWASPNEEKSRQSYWKVLWPTGISLSSDY